MLSSLRLAHKSEGSSQFANDQPLSTNDRSTISNQNPVEWKNILPGGAMAVPVSQMWTVASYVLRQKVAGRKRYPLVLMLEPLFRCNLACAGCGKIQYPAHILKTDLSPEDCFKAVDECGAPMVSIPGGEPLMHPQIAEIVEGLVARKKYIYLCTNALLLKEKLHLFKPSKYLSFSVHV